MRRTACGYCGSLGLPEGHRAVNRPTVLTSSAQRYCGYSVCPQREGMFQRQRGWFCHVRVCFVTTRQHSIDQHATVQRRNNPAQARERRVDRLHCIALHCIAAFSCPSRRWRTCCARTTSASRCAVTSARRSSPRYVSVSNNAQRRSAPPAAFRSNRFSTVLRKCGEHETKKA